MTIATATGVAFGLRETQWLEPNRVSESCVLIVLELFARGNR